MKKLYVPFFVFLSFCLFLGDGKQTVIDVFGAAAVICLFIYVRYFVKKQRELPVPLALAWALTILYFIVRSIFSDDVGFSIYSTVRLLDAHLLFYVFYCYATKKMTDVITKSIVWFSLGVLVVSALLSTAPPLLYVLTQMNLLTPIYGHNHVVDILLFALPISLLLALRGRPYVFVTVALFVGILFSVARAATLLSAGIFMIFLIIYKKQLPFFYTFAFWTCLSVVGVTMMIIALPASQYGRIVGYTSPLSRDKGSMATNIRLEYWKQAVAAFAERPLFGGGPGTYYLQSKRLQNVPKSYSWFAHNFIFEWLAELGLVGTLLLLGLLFWPLVYVKLGHPLWCGVVVLLIYGLFDYPLSYLVLWFLLWSSLGVLASLRGKPVRESFVVRLSIFISFMLLLGFYMVSLLGYFGWKNAVMITESGALNLMESGKRTYDDRILLLHQKNPEVLFQAGQFREAVGMDAQNAVYLKRYIDLLISKDEKKQIGEALMFAGARVLPSASQALLKEANLTSEELLDFYSLDFFQSAVVPITMNQYLSKIYYLLGLEMLAIDPAKTRTLWVLARDMSPRWGHFYVELSALERYIFHDERRADEIFNECLGVPESQGQCSEVKTGGEFSEPGLLKDLIRAI